MLRVFQWQCRLDGLRNSINPDIVLFIAGHSSSWKDWIEGHWEQWTLSSIPIQGDFTSFAHLRHFIVQWSPEIYGAYVPKVGWLKHDFFYFAPYCYTRLLFRFHKSHGQFKEQARYMYSSMLICAHGPISSQLGTFKKNTVLLIATMVFFEKTPSK